MVIPSRTLIDAHARTRLYSRTSYGGLHRKTNIHDAGVAESGRWTYLGNCDPPTEETTGPVVLFTVTCVLPPSSFARTHALYTPKLTADARVGVKPDRRLRSKLYVCPHPVSSVFVIISRVRAGDGEIAYTTRGIWSEIRGSVRCSHLFPDDR